MPAFLIFIPSHPADLRFSYFTGHLGLIKISFKDYKSFGVLERGRARLLCLQDYLKPYFRYQFAQQNGFGQKIDTAAATFKITQSDLEKHGLPEETNPPNITYHVLF